MQPSNPRLLLIAKQLFLEGRKLAAHGDYVGVMKATLFLDLAVEQMLNILVRDFSIDDNEIRDDVKWSQLWQHAISAVKKANVMTTIPHHKELKILRELRNLALHGGVIPDATEVSRLVLAVERMLTSCFYEPYQLTLETFQILDAIRNHDLKRLLRESEQVLELGDPVMALAGIRVAFEEIVGAIASAARGGFERNRFRWSNSRIRVPDAYREPSLAEVAGQVERFIEELGNDLDAEVNEIREDAVIANLGVSMSETGKYNKIRGLVGVDMNVSGRWYVEELTLKTVDQYREDVRFSFSYVTGLALLAEEAFPEATSDIRIEIPLMEQEAWKARSNRIFSKE